MECALSIVLDWVLRGSKEESDRLQGKKGKENQKRSRQAGRKKELDV
jgi:hypothetical protein